MPTITRHTTFKQSFRSLINGAPEDLSGCTFRAQIRQKPGLRLVADITPELLTDGTDGEYRVLLTPAQTGELPAGSFEWDIMCDYPDGRTECVLPTESIEIKNPITTP